MNESILIYAAGDPAAYPLEYYDDQSESYEGIVPQLLERFSDQSAYQIVYYRDAKGNTRDELARDLQVDLWYDCAPAGELPENEPLVEMFETQDGEQTLVHYLVLTQAAPEGLGAELERFFSGVSQARVSGMLLEAASGAGSQGLAALPLGLILGSAALVALLAVVLTLVLRRYRQLRSKAKRYMERDPITELGNYSYLERRYRQLINGENRALYSMVCFSVDTRALRLAIGSGQVRAGLLICARVLPQYAGEGAILAKVSPSDFILMRMETNLEATKAWVGQAVDEIRARGLDSSERCPVNVAAGIVPLSEEDQDLDQLVFNAMQVANDALHRQRESMVFSSETRKALQVRQELHSTVESALEGREFQLYIQFYVDAAGHRFIGGEALSRWQHPKYGLLAPGAFVPLLEEEGLIHKLDFYCFRDACAFLERLWNRGIDSFFMACNFSRETFAGADFPRRCEEVLADYHFPRRLLVFEITESATSRHPERIRANILLLKEQGIRITLDDFGRGFTAFSDLQEFPVNGLKLDKALVDNVGTPTGDAILRGMIQVGHKLGLTILAEGVESGAQAQRLRELGCDMLQGFYFCVPVPEAEAMERALRHI